MVEINDYLFIRYIQIVNHKLLVVVLPKQSFRAIQTFGMFFLLNIIMALCFDYFLCNTANPLEKKMCF